eukprot:TRINITY_DN6130_c0_g5_i1.p1 TRINITY_DN6130_c0_g5~~TRINITY_DN6130_c0_g5_i1.p1  ORF type:complete len:325 (-),score=42.47 TRINITY_DN6130_c0_g5_i1:223-1197(-)
MDYIALLPAGLEFVTEKELISKLPDVKITWVGDGALAFSTETHPFALIGEDGIRSVDRIQILVHHGKVSTKKEAIEQLYEQASTLDWATPMSTFTKMYPEFGDPLSAKEKLTFRATCERFGLDDLRQEYASQDVALWFGGGVNQKLQWKPKMVGYDLEVFINIRNDQLTVGITVWKYHSKIRHKDSVLSKRNRVEMGRTTLNAALSYSMCQLADIQPGQLVVDPMGGVGSIPMEGAMSHPLSTFISGDNFADDVSRASVNIKACCKTGTAIPILWDATMMPLRDGTVDAIVSDLPFGKRHGNFNSNLKLYPKILQEFSRVCKSQ